MNKLQQWAERHKISAFAMAELCVLFSGLEDSTVGAGSEAGVQSRIRVAAPSRGVMLWRNNVGVAVDDTGRHIRYGIANDSKRLNDIFKSSDLIGIRRVLILPQHVGKIIGQFMAIECKAPGWRGPSSEHEKAQHAYLTTVEAFGGVATFAAGVEDFERCA